MSKKLLIYFFTALTNTTSVIIKDNIENKPEPPFKKVKLSRNFL